MQDDIDRIINELLVDKKKEYLCHLRYVVAIGVRLAQEQGGIDIPTITAACLLHDIGRDKEIGDEPHSKASIRIASTLLSGSSFSDAQKEIIYRCIEAHNSETVPASIEEQIVRSADAGSKVEFHEAFMLMCKKTTYEERLAWGMKYLNKGFERVSIDRYKQYLLPKYQSINSIYQSISDDLN